METTQYMSKAQFRADKTRLTRAVNAGDPKKVIAVVEETFARWDAGNFAYPDDWARWERAMRDAETDLLYNADRFR